jgi:hypothetical protein
MRSALTLALALALGSAGVLAKTSECMADCESKYKACASSGKTSERTCRGDYEKCRRACSKKSGTPLG